MQVDDFMAARQSNSFVSCPNCGGDHYESNRFDEALLRQAASEVPRLLFEGKRDEAQDVLIALHAVHIANILRLPLLCLSCGVTFNA